MPFVAWLIENMPPTRYVDRHVSATDEGFVSRHDVIITSQDGDEVHLPCCTRTAIRPRARKQPR
jgi:hypothetical protein